MLCYARNNRVERKNEIQINIAVRPITQKTKRSSNASMSSSRNLSDACAALRLLRTSPPMNLVNSVLHAVDAVDDEMFRSGHAIRRDIGRRSICCAPSCPWDLSCGCVAPRDVVVRWMMLSQKMRCYSGCLRFWAWSPLAWWRMSRWMRSGWRVKRKCRKASCWPCGL